MKSTNFEQSWTYAKLTEAEKAQYSKLWDAVPVLDAIKGTEKHRREVVNAIYYAFILGCGYSGWNWRTEGEQPF